MDALQRLDEVIEDYFDNFWDYFLSKTCEEVVNWSDFSSLEKYIVWIKWKMILSSLLKISDNSGLITYRWYPFAAIVAKNIYTMTNKDYDDLNIPSNINLYCQDLYFKMFWYRWDDENILRVKWFYLHVILFQLIYSKGANIYLFFNSSEEDEIFDSTFMHLILKFHQVIWKSMYLWFSPRIIYASYIYKHIISYKYSISKIDIPSEFLFDLLHRMYKTNWKEPDLELKELLRDEILNNPKRLSSKYAADEHLDYYVHCLRNPYTVSSSHSFSQIDDIESSISEYVSFSDKNSSITFKDIQSLLANEQNDILYYILYEIYFEKLSIIPNYWTKSFEESFYSIIEMMWKIYALKLDKLYYKIFLNNLSILHWNSAKSKNNRICSEIFSSLQTQIKK